MKGQALKGQLDMLVMAMLSAEPQHGYGVIRSLQLRSEGAFDLAEGTIYPVLHRLERQSWVASRWSTEGGRKRRVYHLTPRGKRALGEQRDAWTRFSRAVELVAEV